MVRSITDDLEQLRLSGLYRRTKVISGRQSSMVQMAGRDVLMLCSNNYLGLADHQSLIDASVSATRTYGTSSCASRLVSGTMELHEQLEQEIAAFKGTQAALVFNSGYAANAGILGALAHRGDMVFSDRLNHASIVDGALLSGARLIRYPHNDYNALELLLKKHPCSGRAIIVTDGVFSMDGDMAPLQELVALKEKFGALLVVDDAHGSGVLGRHGRGTSELLGCESGIDIIMGTCGKAMGSYGAYAALSSELRELMINRSRTFIFSTSLPPAVLAASRAALSIISSHEGNRLRQQLALHADTFRQLLLEYGFRLTGSTTQIIPVITGDAETTMVFAERLLGEGIYVQGIRPPTVPAGSCRLRCTVMATHDSADLIRAADTMAAVGSSLGVI